MRLHIFPWPNTLSRRFNVIVWFRGSSGCKVIFEQHKLQDLHVLRQSQNHLHSRLRLLHLHLHNPQRWLASLRTFLGPMSRLSAPITLADLEFGVGILFALCDCGGCNCWCRYKGFDSQLSLRLHNRLCHLMALRLTSSAWKAELCCVVSQSSWLCCGLHQQRTCREGSHVLNFNPLMYFAVYCLSIMDSSYCEKRQ